TTAGNSWAIFTTMATTNMLSARVNINGATQDVNIGALPNGFHTYLIQPVAGGFQFVVDGVLKTTINAAMPQGTLLKAVFSDYFGSQALQVDSLTEGSLPLFGSFTSRVFDGGGTVAWA